MTNCKNCTYWKNKQRDLNYASDNGICLHPSNNFNTTDGRAIGVLDIQQYKNRKEVTGNPSHDFESIKSPVVIGALQHARYLLVTSEEFECNRHEIEDNFHKE